MVATQDAPRFFSGSVTPFDETEKVSKFEELREISSQLGMLRNRHDYTRTINGIHEKNLDVLQREKEIYDKMGTRTGQKLENMRVEAKKMEKLLSDIKKEQEEAMVARKACEHMIERMKMTKIYLEKRNLSIGKALKDKQQTLKEELDKQRRNREGRIQTRVALRNLEGYVNRETREKVERLHAIEKDVVHKKEISKKREERILRQQEIAEAAANEDRNSKALRTREGLLMLKFLHGLLKKRLEIDMKKNIKIDSAFQKIKRVTALNDIEDILERYLTKEQAYAELMERLNDTRQRIEENNRRNFEMEEKIHGLEMSKKDTSNTAVNLSLIAHQGIKEAADVKERCKKLKSATENIKIWASKFIQKLDPNHSKCNGKLKDYIIMVKNAVSIKLAEVKVNVKFM